MDMQKRQHFGRVLSVVVLVLAAGFAAHLVSAATLTSAYDRLNRVQSGLTTGVVHNIVFTPATTVSGGTDSILLLQFPASDGGKWCQTAGSLTEAVDTENGATGLLGTLTGGGSCTKGNGTTQDTLIICSTGSNTWTSGNLYGVTVSGNTGVLGTSATTSNNILVNFTTGTAGSCTSTLSTTDDTGSIALATLANDQVAVTATVPPLLSFSISGASVGFGTLTSANVYYANTAGTGATSEPSAGNMTGVTISTNAPSGLIVSASDSGNGASGSGLYKSVAPAHLVTSTSANAVTAGTEGFGLFVDNVSGVSAASGWGSGKSGGTNTISTSAQTVLTAASAVNAGTASVGLVSAISNITPAGAYTDSITLTGTGKF
jgi:hypothetical protein